ATQGSRTSGHEVGMRVRGNRGRGAKDLASFGEVRWDTIHNGEYGWLEITRNGEVRYGKKAQRATPEIRERLGISHGTGTVATITCRGNVTRPRQSTLKQR